MAGWLDSEVAGAVIGADLLSGVDTDSFAVHVEAARTFVEDRRPDLFGPALDEDGLPVLDEDAVPVVEFDPPKHVVLAAAMLAYRTYSNRTKPEAEVGDATELRVMLGIGKSRGLRFGGARVVPVVVP